MPETPQHPPYPSAPDFDNIGGEVARSVELRSLRRAAAINAVQMAREHGKRGICQFTQSDADTIMYITELLDKVTGNL